MDMKTTSVAMLKQNLSAYLHCVEEGDEVLVTSHRKPVARLIPETDLPFVIRPPSLSLKKLKGIRGVSPKKGVSSLDILLSDRERR
jgi:prevent-host-death family protein